MELTAVFIVIGKCEGKPDATFSFADDDFMAVSSGSINPQMAFVRYIEELLFFIDNLIEVLFYFFVKYR
jgi:hypothetical protein